VLIVAIDGIRSKWSPTGWTPGKTLQFRFFSRNGGAWMASKGLFREKPPRRLALGTRSRRWPGSRTSQNRRIQGEKALLGAGSASAQALDSRERMRMQTKAGSVLDWTEEVISTLALTP
jgi:hypothetical protein